MRLEVQTKTRHLLRPDDLLAMGAEWIGNVEGVNHYLDGCPPGVIRSVRIEGNTCHYTEKGPDCGDLARVKQVDERQIDPVEARRLMKRHRVTEKVEVTSRLYSYRGGVISLDEVTGLGAFVEVRSLSDEEALISLLETLGIEPSECTKESYYELMSRARISWWKRRILRFHKQVTEATFGFTSGTMTTSGMMAGMFVSAPTSKPIVAMSIMVLAVADSLSEAFGMFQSKLSEGMSGRNAFRHALWTAAGNIVVPAIYLVPIFLMKLSVAITLDLAIGGLLLITLSSVRSIANLERSFWPALKGLAVGSAIVALTSLTGKLEAILK